MTENATATKLKFAITGVDCPSCGEGVCDKVRKLSGVASADYNAMNSTLTVVASNGSVDRGNIEDIIKKAGYGAAPVSDGGAKARATHESASKNKMELILTSLSGACLAIANILHYGFNAGGLRVDAFFFLSMVFGMILLVPEAVKGLKRLSLDMNFLMLIAVAGAAAIGEYHEAAMVAFLFSVAHYLEDYSLERARRAVRSTMSMAPPTALVTYDGLEKRIPVEDVRIGDIIIIKPGDRAPVDGVIVSGSTYIDQSAITGESLPIHKNIGDDVYAGTINQRGSIEVKATRVANDTTLARIIHLVEEAQESRAPAQKAIDKFAKIYTPVVILSAVAMMFAPTLLFGQPFKPWFYKALVMLVISCPCALVISTPVALVTAMSAAARAGALIKGGARLEALAGVRAVAFDKTGTLTHGNPTVTDIINLNGHTKEKVILAAASVNCRSEHHVGKAIREKAVEMGLKFHAADEFEAMAGMGASGIVEGDMCFVGNHKMLEQVGYCEGELCRRLESLESEGRTVIVAGKAGEVFGFIIIEDKARECGAEAVAALRRRGIKHIVMLTGDNKWTAERIASQMGITEIKSGLLPEDKLDAVKELIKTHGSVAMVGDGVNDSPALAASTVGIAMGVCGTDAALETADIALMSDDLMKLPFAVSLGKRTLSIIRQNIIFAVGLKAMFMIAAAAGVATLWMAVFADTGASLIVVANSMRLIKNKQIN